jgi:hypothetical protein
VQVVSSNPYEEISQETVDKAVLYVEQQFNSRRPIDLKIAEYAIGARLHVEEEIP